ncbi:hypothetical protein ESCO_000544 [Escovopsis weberi]|uniref:Uncharacterized protein n=1 Tax=Escovopsis weberi TaxID=150374 RepID=A0A0M9VTN1_ESCWE|nr:hypothetical protein ESCO_000544 [Escovopsis weberi]
MSLSARRRRLEVPTEGSWRLVDGENDSFDTRYLSSFDDDDDEDDQALGSSASQLSAGYPSQYSFSASHGGASFDSQDSIRDFTNHHDDEQLILREPFRPTVPPSVSCGSTTTATSRPSLYHHPGPDLQLRMPRVDIDSDLTSSERDSLRTSRGDWQWNQGGSDAVDPNSMDESEECVPCRARRKSSQSQPRGSLEHVRKAARRASETSEARDLAGPRPSRGSSPRTWATLRLALSYSIASTVLGLTAYLLYSNTNSPLSGIRASLAAPFFLTTSLGPICRLPGASSVSLPFCEPPDAEPPKRARKTKGSAACNVDFRDLVASQAKLEDILQRGRRGSSMPLELEASEMATRSLRSSLKDSGSGPARSPPLVPELSNYIDKVGRAGPSLQALYIHVESTVDAVIHINRWTIRHMGSLSLEPDTAELPRLLAWARRLLHPSRTSRRDLHGRILLDKYAEHIALVQARLERLIDEASALLPLLSHARDLLIAVRALARDSLPPPPPPRRPSLLSSLWSYVGRGPTTDGDANANANAEGNNGKTPRDARAHLRVLEAVDAQLSDTISHVRRLVEALRDIRAEMQDLLRRTAEPPDAWAEDAPPSTLSEQIDIVRGGLRRLEDARRRGGTSS